VNIYLVSHPEPDYETYTDMLIAANSAAEAKDISVKSVEAEYQDGIGHVWVKHSRMDTLKTMLLGVADDGIEKGFIKSWWKNG
jgi:hypothetical protein